MSQLMRMVLNESLKALKTQGWEERCVLAGCGERLCAALGVGPCVSLAVMRREERSGGEQEGDPMVLTVKHVSN